MSRKYRIMVWLVIAISLVMLLFIGAYESIVANLFNVLLVWHLEKLQA